MGTGLTFPFSLQPAIMLKAAHRFYDNEDVFFDFLKSCPKDTLLRLMMTEQSGPNFDQCVKELYGRVKYQDIRGMTRDSVSPLDTSDDCH
jgi:hypothetical protein